MFSQSPVIVNNLPNEDSVTGGRARAWMECSSPELAALVLSLGEGCAWLSVVWGKLLLALDTPSLQALFGCLVLC